MRQSHDLFVLATPSRQGPSEWIRELKQNIEKHPDPYLKGPYLFFLARHSNMGRYTGQMTSRSFSSRKPKTSLRFFKKR